MEFLWTFTAACLGCYVLLAALALGGLDNARWGLALVPVAVALFLLAALPARRLVGRR